MGSPASQPSEWQSKVAQRLVDDHNLRPGGLGPEQLDLLLQDRARRADFFYHYDGFLSQLGPTIFWGLIADLSGQREAQASK
jgi:hypothetical protein